jgi:hypothetical protein
MQQLVAFHKDRKSIILMEFFKGLAIGLFIMLKVKLLIHKYVYVDNNHFTITKCECSSIILVMWTSEFIASPLSPIQWDQQIHYKSNEMCIRTHFVLVFANLTTIINYYNPRLPQA